MLFYEYKRQSVQNVWTYFVLEQRPFYFNFILSTMFLFGHIFESELRFDCYWDSLFFDSFDFFRYYLVGEWCLPINFVTE